MNGEQQNEQSLKGYKISFELYAHDEQEVENARMAIVAFIGLHARQGRAVTAQKVAKAVSNWDKNPIVKNRIIEYFK